MATIMRGLKPYLQRQQRPSQKLHWVSLSRIEDGEIPNRHRSGAFKPVFQRFKLEISQCSLNIEHCNDHDHAMLGHFKIFQLKLTGQGGKVLLVNNCLSMQRESHIYKQTTAFSQSRILLYICYDSYD